MLPNLSCHICSWIRFFFHFALTKKNLYTVSLMPFFLGGRNFLFMEPFSLYPRFPYFGCSLCFTNSDFTETELFWWSFVVLKLWLSSASINVTSVFDSTPVFVFRWSSMTRKCHNKIFTLDHSRSNTRFLISFKTGWDFPRSPTLSLRLCISNESSSGKFYDLKYEYIARFVCSVFLGNCSSYSMWQN